MPTKDICFNQEFIKIKHKNLYKNVVKLLSLMKIKK